MGIHLGKRHSLTIGCSSGRYWERQWFGVRIDESNSSPDVQRIAGSVSAMKYHATQPILSLFRGCTLFYDGTVNYYLKPTDWTKRENEVAANLDGSEGQVMVERPVYYRKVVDVSSTVHEIRHSLYPIPGFEMVKKHYYGAYEASLQRSTLKLSSVRNSTADYRGGNNNAAWDSAGNSLLSKPVTAISLVQARTYARNRADTHWNVETLYDSMLLYELFIVAYATLNCQKAVNNTLTTEGYRQGGLGSGVTLAVSTEWNTFSSYYPFISCGSSDSLGNGSGEVQITIPNFGGSGINRTFPVPRFLGIENPFGHIWKWIEGSSVFHEASGGESKLYVCNNPVNFADATSNNYEYVGNLPKTEGYVKSMNYHKKAGFFPKETGGASSTYWSDYYYTPGQINAWRALLCGGAATAGTAAGFGCLYSNSAASVTAAYFGARLCYIP